MIRYLLLHISCALLVQPALGTFPILQSTNQNEPGPLGKLLLARHSAKLPTLKPMRPSILGNTAPNPTQSQNVQEGSGPSLRQTNMDQIDSSTPPNKSPAMTAEERSANDGKRQRELEFSQLEILETNEDEIDRRPGRPGHFENQGIDFVDFDEDIFRAGQPTTNEDHKNTFQVGQPAQNAGRQQFLKPGKHFPEGYPTRVNAKPGYQGNSLAGRAPHPNEQREARDMHRVLDAPLPQPGDMPTYTVFVRSSDPRTGASPVVHIVKHSVQSIVPIDAEKEQEQILGMHMWNVPQYMRNDGSEYRAIPQSTQNPDEVLGAAKRDLIFRTGNLYGIPQRGDYGHGGYGQDAFGHTGYVHPAFKPAAYGHGQASHGQGIYGGQKLHVQVGKGYNPYGQTAYGQKPQGLYGVVPHVQQKYRSPEMQTMPENPEMVGINLPEHLWQPYMGLLDMSEQHRSYDYYRPPAPAPPTYYQTPYDPHQAAYYR